MNKKIISALMISAMLVSQTAAFAEVGSTGLTKSVEPISEETEVMAPAFVAFENYTVVAVSDNTIELVDENGESAFIATERGVMFDEDGTEITVSDIAEGDVLTFYLRGTDAVLAIYPPQYSPVVIVRAMEDYEGAVKVANFRKSDEGERAYISAEEDLVIHLPEDFIENRKMDNDYIVFYTTATSSLPPQTTPDKLVLLPEEYIEEPVEESIYSDVSADDWFCDSVVWASENGIFKGVSETEFAPSTSLTRAMFVTILGRFEGLAVKDACVTGFSDAAADAYYSSYVAWANENGIVTGYEDGTFKPDQAVTRQEAMVILKRYCDYKNEAAVEIPEDVEVSYADTDEIAGYVGDAAIWNAAKGFLFADENNNVRPTDETTRAEAAYAIKTLAELN